MAERLVVLSDMWGAKKGLWITSYLGYLQQYFEIVYYDSQELANLEVTVRTPENVCKAFVEGGYSTAIAHLLSRETQPSHYLTFCAGGTIAWSAALQGLPMKSLYAVSPLWLHRYANSPEAPAKLLFGEYQENKPAQAWAQQLGVDMEVMPNFGRELYSDEKIIGKICLELLESVTQQPVTPELTKQLSTY
jgi:hypothetical protein